jgi:hypothetical protein
MSRVFRQRAEYIKASARVRAEAANIPVGQLAEQRERIPSGVYTLGGHVSTGRQI